MAEIHETVVALVTARGDSELRAQIVIDALTDLRTPEHETLLVSHLLLELLVLVDQAFDRLDELHAADGSTAADALRASIAAAAADRASTDPGSAHPRR